MISVPVRSTIGSTLVIVLCCLLAALQVPVAASPADETLPAASESSLSAVESSQSAFVVALDTDGSARMTLSTTFDLTTESDRASFDALRANATLRDHRVGQFESRMVAVAEEAASRTGREMAVRNATIAFDETGDTGVVSLGVTWDGLASPDGDRLIVAEPFADGFSIDRPFRIVGPDGHELDTVSPSPQNRTTNAATWAGGADLDGFEAVFTPSTTADSSDATQPSSLPADSQPTTAPVDFQPTTSVGESGPGFGFVVAGIALLLTAMLWTVRR